MEEVPSGISSFLRLSEARHKKNAPARGLPGHSKEGVHRISANVYKVLDPHGIFVTIITVAEKYLPVHQALYRLINKISQRISEPSAAHHTIYRCRTEIKPQYIGN
ncbi:MAG: hypothetical protein HC850_18555 [Rhodomicrobium sp.]|nr:hypothetical protein [Rhodomicrobium sp.]